MRVSYASFTFRFFTKYITDHRFKDIITYQRSIVLGPRSSFHDVSDFLNENSDTKEGKIRGVLEWRARLFPSAGDGDDLDLPLVSFIAL